MIDPHRAALAAAALFLLAGCKADIAVEVVVGDALELAAFNPRITGVILRQENGETLRLTDDRLRELDLASLAPGETRVLIDSREIGAGTYTGIALSVAATGGSLRYEGEGQTRTLGPVDGLFAPINLRIREDDEARVRVVLEPHFSLTDPRLSGGSGTVRFRPVVRAVATGDGRQVEGAVRAGLVEGSDCRNAPAPARGAAIYAFDAALGAVNDYAEGSTFNPRAVAVIRHDVSDGYRYRFRELPEGDYTLALLCAADQDRPDQLQGLPFLTSRSLNLRGENALVDFD